MFDGIRRVQCFDKWAAWLLDLKYAQADVCIFKISHDSTGILLNSFVAENKYLKWLHSPLGWFAGCNNYCCLLLFNTVPPRRCFLLACRDYRHCCCIIPDRRTICCNRAGGVSHKRSTKGKRAITLYKLAWKSSQVLASLGAIIWFMYYALPLSSA